MADEHLKGKKRNPTRPTQPPAGRTEPLLKNLEDFVVEEIEIGGVATPASEARHRAAARRPATLRLGLGAAALALLAVLAALVARSAWPVDETRTLAIAWEMWTRGEWLVPRLNDAPVAVAPLFFWLTRLGWQVVGVQEWWPRLIPALFMLASLFVAVRMAALLWPGDPAWTRRVPFVLLGSFFWLASATLLTPDFLTVFFTLLALHALLWIWRTRDQRVWPLLGLWLGLGLLAGGSLMLLYVLPIALLARLWARGTPTMPWKYWYLDIFKALLVGGALFAAWLLPAAARVTLAAMAPVLTAPFATHALDLHAGSYPWWWLLALLPVVGFPWSLWPLPWLRFWHIRREPIGNGLAFCMLWGAVTLALLLLSPLRQPQLLLPLMPAFFLVMAWLVLDERHAGHDHSHVASTMIFPLLLLGAALAVLPKLPRVDVLPAFLWQLSPFVGVAIVGVGVVIGFLPLPSLAKRVTNLAATVAVLATLALLALGWQFNDRFNLEPAAQLVARAQQQGQAVAHVGPYQGQLHFAGRLTRPLDVVDPAAAGSWAAAHPDGVLVTYMNGWQPPAPATATPLHDQPYRDTRLRLWSVAALRAAEEVAAPDPAGP